MDKNHKATYVFSDEQLLLYDVHYSVEILIVRWYNVSAGKEDNDSLINFPKLKNQVKK